MIAIDFSMLSQNRLPRCAYQLANLAEIAERQHFPVKVVVTSEQVDTIPILRRVKHLLSNNYDGVKLYIAKSDTFYFNRNYDRIRDLPAFKVCLSSSDRVFREHDGEWQGEQGGAVQNRCDLYMPVNTAPQTLKDFGHKMIPVAHRPSTQFVDLLEQKGLINAYLDDDLQVIRNSFQFKLLGLAGFMGNSGYGERRVSQTQGMPEWVKIIYRANASAFQFVRNLMSYRACVDLRGAGDKSLRFVEAVLLGRTVIARRQGSPYYPPLVDGHNAIIVENWSDLESKVDLDLWQAVADRATEDYLKYWSQLAQFRMILERSKYGQHSP